MGFSHRVQATTEYSVLVLLRRRGQFTASTASMPPLQNRVTPWSAIVAHPARYAEPTVMFGNRGVLHGQQRNILRPFNGKMWLACTLHVDRTRKRQRDDNRAFNGRKRILMTPNRYTELFFIDEPTAMAAGHRPCACCRRGDHVRFMDSWSKAFPRQGENDGPWTAASVDAHIHDDRLDGKRCKRLYTAPLGSLPDGVFVTLDAPFETCDSATGEEPQAWLLWAGMLHRWTHHGYIEHQPAGLDRSRSVHVLTPRSLVATLQAGFVPGPPHASVAPTSTVGPTVSVV